MGISRSGNRIIRTCCYGYLVVTLLLWLGVAVAGDRWWPATMLLFAPRWLFALPAAVLVPFAALADRRSLLLVLTAGLIVVGPLMRFSFPLSKRPVAVKPLRIVTCNLQNGDFDRAAMDALLRNTQPDFVALQELPADIKIAALNGWHHVFEGDLHIYARFPLTKGDSGTMKVPLHKWPRACFLCCTVKAPSGDLTVATVHLPSPRYGLQSILDKRSLISLARKQLLIDETAYRWEKSREVAAIVAALPSPKVIAGDFNMTVESAIYRADWDDYRNAFSWRGTGYGWTEQASLRGIPVKFRIDHVLTDNKLMPLVCETGPDVGSDHLPVIADIGLQ